MTGLEKGSLKKAFCFLGTGRSMVIGLFSKWWAAQHGRQLGYAAAASGGIGILLLSSLTQILFLQNSDTWGEFTGGAIGLGVVSAVALLVVLPEFFTLRGHALLLEEYESAAVLGAGHEASWTAFLESKGLRR